MKIKENKGKENTHRSQILILKSQSPRSLYPNIKYQEELESQREKCSKLLCFDWQEVD